MPTKSGNQEIWTAETPMSPNSLANRKTKQPLSIIYRKH